MGEIVSAARRTDRRVAKTKAALALAMLNLLSKRPFDKITVLDLCEVSMVSRSAFYIHFDDKYDLLEFTLDTLKEQLFGDEAAGTLEDKLSRLLNAALQRRTILKNLVGSRFDPELGRMLRQGMRQDLEQISLDAGRHKPFPNDEIGLAFYAAGTAAALLTWLSASEPRPVEEIKKTLLRIFYPVE